MQYRLFEPMIINAYYIVLVFADQTWNSTNVLAKQVFEIMSFKRVKFMN